MYLSDHQRKRITMTLHSTTFTNPQTIRLASESKSGFTSVDLNLDSVKSNTAYMYVVTSRAKKPHHMFFLKVRLVKNKFALSFLHQLTSWHCSRVCCWAPCCCGGQQNGGGHRDRSIYPARRAASSKPVQRQAAVDRGTDGQTDGHRTVT